jgi:hypothetical protein
MLLRLLRLLVAVRLLLLLLVDTHTKPGGVSFVRHKAVHLLEGRAAWASFV